MNMKEFTLHKNFTKNVFGAGFTLIEALVAVAILTIAISGAFFSADRAFNAAEIARDQLIASQLAQEGIEYVRMMRDDEYLAARQNGSSDPSSDGWNNFLAGDTSDPASISRCRDSNACSLDPMLPMGSGSGLSLKLCSIAASCSKLFRTTDGKYVTQDYITSNSITGAMATSFSRTIHIERDSVSTPQNEGGIPYHDQRVVSTVSWSFHGVPYSVTITDHLTRWQ